MTGGFFLYILLAIFILLFTTTSFLISILLLRYASYINEKWQSKFITEWQNQLFEYISSDESPKRLISLLPKSGYGKFLDYLRDFLFNLKGSDLEHLEELISEPEFSSYLIKKLRSWSRKRRVKAIYFLRFVKRNIAVDKLSNQLDSPDDLEFRTAAESLAYLKSDENLDRILDLAKARKHFNADSILSMISKFDNSVCPILTRRLALEKSDMILQVIITFLWHHKYTEASASVLQQLLTTNDRNVTIESIRYLGEVEDVHSLTALKLGLDSSRPDVRVATIQAITKIGDTTIEDRLIEKFHDPQLEVKIAAARAMYKLSPKGKAMLYELSNTSAETVEVIIAKHIFIERRVFGNV